MSNREEAQRVVEVALKIITGQIGLIEGSRELARLRFAVAEALDPDFMFFVALDSDTDHLPIGRVRAEWAPEVLHLKDQEIHHLEAEAHDEAISWCQRLVRRFGGDSETNQT